jgi:phosphoserine phosphatase RsbU/P
VMAMVKSAARLGLTRGTPLDELFRDLNNVLVDLTSPAMFVTAVAVDISSSGTQFSVAGHPPILHFHAESRTVDEVTLSNAALGIIPSQSYELSSLNVRAGDVLLLITDGFIEVFDRHDREFGLEAIKQVLRLTGLQPLADVLFALRNATRAHGAPHDDQSALVLRMVRA